MGLRQDLSVTRVGLVGLGEHGTSVLLPLLRSMYGVRLVGLCDEVPDKLNDQRIISTGIPRFRSYSGMVEGTELDAVILAGPPQMHQDLALESMKRDLPVFVEKPPATDTAHMMELAEAAIRGDVTTGVGLNFRHSQPIDLIEQYIKAEELTPISVSVKHTSSKPRQGLWGLPRLRAFLLAQAIHPLDTLAFFGGDVVEVETQSYVANDDMTLSISLKFSGGGIGHLLTGSDSPKFENVLEIITAEDVVFRLDNMWHLTVLDQRRLSPSLPDFKRWGLVWAPSPLSSGFTRSGYELELRRFFEAIAAGSEFSPSFPDSLPLYRVIDAVEADMGGAL